MSVNHPVECSQPFSLTDFTPKNFHDIHTAAVTTPGHHLAPSVQMPQSQHSTLWTSQLLFFWGGGGEEKTSYWIYILLFSQFQVYWGVVYKLAKAPVLILHFSGFDWFLPRVTLTTGHFHHPKKFSRAWTQIIPPTPVPGQPPRCFLLL
jgi:hypothetical protein